MCVSHATSVSVCEQRYSPGLSADMQGVPSRSLNKTQPAHHRPSPAFLAHAVTAPKPDSATTSTGTIAPLSLPPLYASNCTATPYEGAG